MTLTVLWAAKGGAGTTVVAAGWALETPMPSVLVDAAGDMHHVLGVPTPPGQGLSDWFDSDAPPGAVLDLAIEITPTTRYVPHGSAAVPRRSPRWDELGRWMTAAELEFVVDIGLGPPPEGLLPVEASGGGGPNRARSLLVSRACFVALARARSLGETPDGIVLVEEAGRLLSADDLARSLGAPVVAKIAYDPSIGRATDRGLLLGKLPRSIVKLVQQVA